MFEQRDGFRRLGTDGFVRTSEYVQGVGPRTSFNRYLVVQESNGGKRYVQSKLTSRRWTVRAQFGESLTPDGTRFRVYIFTTPTELFVGEIPTDVPDDSTPPFEQVVILKK